MSSNEELILCPECKDLMSPPIYQCSKGHSICGKCKKNPRIIACICCNMPITEMRNYQLEQLIENLKYKIKLECKYRYKGCTYKVKANEKKIHEKQCRYNTHKCEASTFLQINCSWKGSFDNIFEHFSENHQEMSKANFKHCGMFKINNNWQHLQVINFANGHNIFYSKIKIDSSEEKVYYWCKMVGLENLAMHYYYEFEIYKGDVKKVKHTSYCNSHAIPDKEIINKESCAVFTFKQLGNFKNANDEIYYRYRIMKDHNTN